VVVMKIREVTSEHRSPGFHWPWLYRAVIGSLCLILIPVGAKAQSPNTSQEVEQLRQTVQLLEARVAALETEVNGHKTGTAAATNAEGTETAASLSTAVAALRTQGDAPAASSTSPVPPASSTASAPLPGTLPGGITLNYLFDGYYEYNYNHPIGQVNELRAYDVSSNSFSINQADVVIDMEPDVTAKRRYGARLDLMFGQATETLQGSAANELRPQVWRNVFQAYGSYIFPAGTGLRVDFGKFASALGAEGNYTKDQINYTRSYLFNFLPFYHMGFRASYDVTPKVNVTGWLVNGTEQTEDFNGFKSIGLITTLKPTSSLTWNVNYYTGQEQRAVVANTSTAVPPIPIQPGQPLENVSPTPNGREHIFDTYATWNINQRWTAAGEADYLISRVYSEGPPSHADAGAVYLKYQWTPKLYLAARSEYVADPNGFFSTASQDLKEGTATLQYQFSDGFATYLEYRRDWSNRNFFLTSQPGVLIGHQDTTALGMVWWYGGKQGSW